MSPPVTLEPGQQAPDFTATDGSGAEHRLSDYLSKGKTVILYFYPKDSTPGCTTQACDFRDNMNRLQSENTIVFGVSKDSAASHQKFATKQALNFPLLVDEDLSLHHAFGTWRLKKITEGNTWDVLVQRLSSNRTEISVGVDTTSRPKVTSACSCENSV